MVKVSRNLAPFILFIVLAASFTVVGELSGEFRQIRQLSSKPQNALNTTRGEFVSLNNHVFFGFDVNSGGADVLKVKLTSNQTYSWYEPIEKGKRIYRSENFTLDAVECFFEVDLTVKFYDKQTLQVIDHTEQKS